ncbi:MAG: peptidylprolyl isomerase [Lentisphaeria bacterium]|nr:peptidylprolyl isomerase [Lentisphaeria bacterium]
MKRTTLIVSAAGLTVAAACLFGTVSAADAKAQPQKAEAKPAAAPAAQPAEKQLPAPRKQQTMEEAFSFLPETLATIGDRKITKKELLERIGNVPPEMLAQFPPEVLKARVKQMIDGLVNEEIVIMLAEKAGIKPSKELLLAEMDREIKAMPPQQRDMIEQQLKLQNRTIEDVKKEMANDPMKVRAVAIPVYIREKVKPTIKITDADIEKFYRENQDKFKLPERVSASHILITNRPDENAAVKPDAAALAKLDQEAKAKAEKILAQLKQGADFAKLAAQESACPSKARGGSLGEFTREGMVPEFSKAAFALTKKGELSGVVKTMYGYHIIRLDEKKPAEIHPLDQELKDYLRNYLPEMKLSETIQKQIADAKKSMNVKIAEIK